MKNIVKKTLITLILVLAGLALFPVNDSKNNQVPWTFTWESPRMENDSIQVRAVGWSKDMDLGHFGDLCDLKPLNAAGRSIFSCTVQLPQRIHDLEFNIVIEELASRQHSVQYALYACEPKQLPEVFGESNVLQDGWRADLHIVSNDFGSYNYAL